MFRRAVADAQNANDLSVRAAEELADLNDSISKEIAAEQEKLLRVCRNWLPFLNSIVDIHVM